MVTAVINEEIHYIYRFQHELRTSDASISSHTIPRISSLHNYSSNVIICSFTVFLFSMSYEFACLLLVQAHACDCNGNGYDNVARALSVTY